MALTKPTMSSRLSSTPRISMLLLSLLLVLLPTLAEAVAVERPYDATRPHPDFKLMYQHEIPNCPGKSIVGFTITLAPGGATAPHVQRNAFVAAHILSGYAVTARDNEASVLLGPGAPLFELPGHRHRIFENPSKTDNVVAFAAFILDTATIEEYGTAHLVIVDQEYVASVEDQLRKNAGLDP